MKRWVRSLLTFNSLEQKGIAALLIICILLLLVYIALPYVVPEKQLINDPELLAAYEQYKQQHMAGDQPINEEEDTDSHTVGQFFKFDPNKLDSNGFIALGMRARTVHLLLNWRRKGKVFRSSKELSAVYTLTAEEYQRLEPYITINEKELYPDKYWPENENGPSTIDLNLADSGSLVRINGIGPTLAHKILQRRKALGGFLKYEQLNEVYRFPDTTFRTLKERLVINIKSVKRLKLNTCNYEELSAHPYIGSTMAKNIILFREGLKHYDNIEQLRQVPLMNDENYRKIAPYLVVE